MNGKVDICKWYNFSILYIECVVPYETGHITYLDCKEHFVCNTAYGQWHILGCVLIIT